MAQDKAEKESEKDRGKGKGKSRSALEDFLSTMSDEELAMVLERGGASENGAIAAL